MIIDRSKKPLPEDEIAFKIPYISEFTLDNGLRVLFIKKDTLPIIRMSLVVNAGSKFDPPNKKGLANLLAFLIDEGAGKFNALELSDEFELLGTSFSVSCAQDKISLTVQTLKENLVKSLELFNLVITQPKLDLSDFEREKRRAFTKLLQYKDNPAAVAESVFDSLVFNEFHPYSSKVLGTESGVKNIEHTNVIDFYDKLFVPFNSTLVAAGNLESEELLDILNSTLGRWQSKTKQPPLQISASTGAKGIYIVNKENAVQSEIIIGYQTAALNLNNYYSLFLLNMILGGQFSSRINLNLREEKGITYGASSNFDYYQHGGKFSVSTSVSVGDTHLAVTEILKELNLIRIGITDDELTFSKTSKIRLYPAGFETYPHLTGKLFNMVTHSFPMDFYETYTAKISEVKLNEVNLAAANEFNTDKLCIVIVSDRDKLVKSLKPLDSFSIHEVDHEGNPVSNF
jgi:predicted Zn-dependent peptidase